MPDRHTDATMPTRTEPKTSRKNPKAPDDPLQTLERRIERARTLDVTEGVERRNGRDHPLERLERRIASARDPEGAGTLATRAARARPPLDALYERILEAREFSLKETTKGEQSGAIGDPLQRLRGEIQREIDELGARPSVTRSRARSADRSGAESPSHAADTSIEERLGGELLEMLAERDLPGRDRAEAVARLAQNLDDPDPDRTREVLRILVLGREER